ncbi:MAG: hypothetical protein BIFFINMI_02679 [Phycisphaerae bacterium]|nr:hypothetical protein [Phycisphaerae bacterium]
MPRLATMTAADLAEQLIGKWDLRSTTRANAWERMTHFLRFALSDGMDLSEARVVLDDGGQIAWFCICVHSPGRTGLLVLGPTNEGAVDADAAAAVRALVADEGGRGIGLVQALLPPSQRAEGRLLRSSGFTNLAELIYLEGELAAAPGASSAGLGEAVTFTEASSPLFADTIQKTYEQTLDCPGLEGLRRMEDIMAGHRGSGKFRPDLWFLFGQPGSPAGIVLLNEVANQLGDTVELVYMGVVPAARGRGLGRGMLGYAMSAAARAGYRRILLAVDSLNEPAIRLYRVFGLSETMRRIAWICRTTEG